MENIVKVEIVKNKFLNLEYNKAIDLAVNEYFKGNVVKINNKDFDVMNFGNYKDKLIMQN